MANIFDGVGTKFGIVLGGTPYGEHRLSSIDEDTKCLFFPDNKGGVIQIHFKGDFEYGFNTFSGMTPYGEEILLRYA